MEKGKADPYIEKFFKSAFCVLVGIPVLLIVALLTLFIITLWYAEIVWFLRRLISALPLIWIFFSVAVFVSGSVLFMITKLKKCATYQKQIKKIIVTSGASILLFTVFVYIIYNGFLM